MRSGFGLSRLDVLHSVVAARRAQGFANPESVPSTETLPSAVPSARKRVSDGQSSHHCKGMPRLHAHGESCRKSKRTQRRAADCPQATRPVCRTAAMLRDQCARKPPSSQLDRTHSDTAEAPEQGPGTQPPLSTEAAQSVIDRANRPQSEQPLQVTTGAASVLVVSALIPETPQTLKAQRRPLEGNQSCLYFPKGNAAIPRHRKMHTSPS